MPEKRRMSENRSLPEDQTPNETIDTAYTIDALDPHDITHSAPGPDGITAAVDKTDWTRYAGQVSQVKRRGERRRRRLQAGTALGTTCAVVGVAVAVGGLNQGPATRQGASATHSSSTPAHITPANTAGTASSPASSPEPSPAAPAPSNYPSFPAQLPTKPILVSDPGKVLQSGVIGAGSVSGHQWQLSYRIIPSGSAANSQPEVSQVDFTMDGKTVTTGGGEGTTLEGGGGYAVLQPDPAEVAKGFFPMVVASGSPSPGVTGVNLRWKNGTVIAVPIRTVTGARFATFAWDPGNPPDAVEQVRADGVQEITITHDGTSSWRPAPQRTAITPAAPPSATTPSGTPNLSQTPKVTPHDSGLLGAGTAGGHPWQIAYEIIPSGSAANSSDEVFCTDTTVDGSTQQGGCTSGKPFGGDGFSIGFEQLGGKSQFPIVTDYGTADTGTTAVGLEFADGTTTVTTVHDVEGAPMVALAFDPANGPAYLLEFGSYGEYRIPLAHSTHYTWTFNW